MTVLASSVSRSTSALIALATWVSTSAPMRRMRPFSAVSPSSNTLIDIPRSIRAYLAIGACSGMARCKAEEGRARGAYWEAPGGTKHSRGIAVVREHARPTDNAADGHSWTGSYTGDAGAA